MAPTKKLAAICAQPKKPVAICAPPKRIVKKPKKLPRYVSKRVQFHGVRFVCRPGKEDDLRRELSEAFENAEDDKDWTRIAKQIGSQAKWGACTHGGARKGATFVPQPRGGLSAIGDIVNSQAIGEHISKTSAGSSSAIVAETNKIVRKRIREKTTVALAIGSNEALAIGSEKAALLEAPCTPRVDARCMEASVVGSKTPAIGTTSLAIGRADSSLPRVLPATRSPGIRSATYTIIERIGGGSFGDVYKAKPKEATSGLPAIFVVKLLHKSSRKARSTTEQDREISVMKELAQANHPNVLKFLGWRGTHFNVQLLLELHDQDLRSYIKGKPLPLGACKKLTRDLFLAVACVHSRSILHRDIKTANILIRRQPLAAILGDFGCARKLLPDVEGDAQQQHLTQDVCTLWYRAPEILLSHNRYGYSSDVWSLGVVLVEMQNGIPPFRKSSEIGMLFAMFKMLGTPTWCKELEMMRDFRGALGTCPFPAVPRPRVFPFGSADQQRDLIQASLDFSPSTRISADDASRHAWLS